MFTVESPLSSMASGTTDICGMALRGTWGILRPVRYNPCPQGISIVWEGRTNKERPKYFLEDIGRKGSPVPPWDEQRSVPRSSRAVPGPAASASPGRCRACAHFLGDWHVARASVKSTGLPDCPKLKQPSDWPGRSCPCPDLFSSPTPSPHPAPQRSVLL